MGFNRPGIILLPAPAGFKWEKQEDGRYKLKLIKNQDEQEKKADRWFAAHGINPNTPNRRKR